jgi:hypothetical protein
MAFSRLFVMVGWGFVGGLAVDAVFTDGFSGSTEAPKIVKNA